MKVKIYLCLLVLITSAAFASHAEESIRGEVPPILPEDSASYIAPSLLPASPMHPDFLLLACNEGSIHYSGPGEVDPRIRTETPLEKRTRKYRSCNPVYLGPRVVTALPATLNACIRELLPDENPTTPITLIHWGTYQDRLYTASGSPTAHADAEAIDIHAVQFGKHSLNYEKAFNELARSLESYVQARSDSSSSTLSQEDLLALERDFYAPFYSRTSGELKPEYIAFWQKLTSCVTGRGWFVLPAYLDDDLGVTPEFEPAGNGRFFKRLKKKSVDLITVHHENHIHVGTH